MATQLFAVSSKGISPPRNTCSADFPASNSLAYSGNGGDVIPSDSFPNFDIGQHVERRVQLFFQWAILCYNMPYSLEIGKTEDQIGKGGTRELPNGQKVKTQAAHSSTIPCLYACLQGSDKKFIFYKETHGYFLQNATMELPAEVNRLDTALDGRKGENKLRDKTITILNQCAAAKITPVKATEKFLDAFEKGLENLTTSKEEIRKVQQIYQEYLAEIKEECTTEERKNEIFDALVGVDLKQYPQEKEKLLRDTVYKKRYELIQFATSIEMKIQAEILRAQKEIFKWGQKAVSHVDPKIREALFARFEGENLKCLEKFFCTSANRPLPNLREHEVVPLTEKEKKEKKGIKDLQQYVAARFNELREQELNYRSDLFRAIRQDVFHWKQQEFTEEFRKKNPGVPMSQPGVSRIERWALGDTKPSHQYKTPENQRKKPIPLKLGEQIAKTYDISLAVFMPALITSEY